MIQYLQSLLARRNDEGASAVEYGLMVAAIAAVIVGVVFAIGTVVNGAFSKTETCLKTPDAAACTTAPAAD